ncbi:MAG TPA: UDP-N-acetylmuramoyl-L-alanine--D-glutamate ligase, partial [Thermomicrobiales bacterium]|nr:UDP-N-acetylmuramoyl-L-alanine--D-glutamate ligase [Thermomicrobiales bacterium]
MNGFYDGKRVTVMGLGTRGGGAGVARFLARAGANVTVTDLRPEEALADIIADLAGLPIHYRLGGHDPADFTPERADLIVRNPGVPRRAPLLEAARGHGLPVEMELTIFFRLCPAPIVGVTGTKGKTTVATLCADLLRAWEPATVLAGNMGVSALDQLDRIGPDTPVVLEISSWQLEGLGEHGLSPAVAVITRIAEDHLNTYADFAEYAAVKRSIAAHQRPDDALVLNRDDPETWRAATGGRARVVPFGRRDPGGDGAWLTAGGPVWRRRGAEESYRLPATAPFQGEHNRVNALAAIAAGRLRGAPPAAIQHGLDRFPGIRDRLERVATANGVTFINDTTATAPIAAAAALDASAGERVHLLCGGAAKGLDPTPLVEAICRRRPRVYLFAGTATSAIAERLAAAAIETAGPFPSMDEAVGAARANARPGDVILLSPGCASFGLFRDEFDRGAQFRRLALAAATPTNVFRHPELAPPRHPEPADEGSRPAGALAQGDRDPSFVRTTGDADAAPGRHAELVEAARSPSSRTKRSVDVAQDDDGAA